MLTYLINKAVMNLNTMQYHALKLVFLLIVKSVNNELL